MVERSLAMDASPTTLVHDGPVLDRVADFDVVDCTACGYAHVVPLPTEHELVETYRHEYYATEKPLYLERASEDREWWDRLNAERLDALEALAPGGAPRRLLDVGCGPGLLLAAALERDWACLGIEPSRQAAEHARALGADVVERFLTPALAPELGTFHAVHLAEVLEHVPDPSAILATCRDVLAPGGALCVSVPNDYSAFQRALREVDGFAPWWVAPPHHLNYFSFDSLARLLERCGFEVERRTTTFPIDLFLLMGDDYVGDDARGRECHARRMRMERTLAAAGLDGLRRELYERMAELGIGRHVVLYGRKR